MFHRNLYSLHFVFFLLAALPLVLGLTGCKDDDDEETFTEPPPALTSVMPTSGIQTGGYTATIQGANFQVGAAVRFGGVGATNVTVLDVNLITVEVPAGTGTVDIVVENPDTQVATLAGAFTYSAGPTISGTTPYGGALTGVTGVQIAGTGFQDGCLVLGETSLDALEAERQEKSAT